MGLGAGLPANCLLTVGNYGDSQFNLGGSHTGLPCKAAAHRYVLWNLLQQNGINAFFVGPASTSHDSDVKQVWHSGIDGTRVGTAQAGLVAFTLQNAPEVICYCLGTNDISADGTTAAVLAPTIKTNVSQLWDLGQRAGQNKTKLIEVCSIPDTPAGSPEATKLSPLIRQACAELQATGRNCLFVDLFTALGPNTGTNSGANFDPTSSPHPNDGGHVKIAQALLGTRGSGLLIDWTR